MSVDPYEHVFTTITEASGIPGTLLAYPVGQVPELPWFVYECEDDGSIRADDSDYAALPRFRVELFENGRDKDLEDSIADTIRETYGPVDVTDMWDEAEHCRMVDYEFSFTIKEDEE